MDVMPTLVFVFVMSAAQRTHLRLHAAIAGRSMNLMVRRQICDDFSGFVVTNRRRSRTLELSSDFQSQSESHCLICE